MGSNINKMRDLISKMEHYQSEVERIEDQSLKRVNEKIANGELDPTIHVIYHVAADVGNNFWYTRAVGKRDSYARRATAYGIAALVEKDQ